MAARDLRGRWPRSLYRLLEAVALFPYPNGVAILGEARWAMRPNLIFDFRRNGMMDAREGIAHTDRNRGLRDRLRRILPAETLVDGMDELEVAMKELQDLARNPTSVRARA